MRGSNVKTAQAIDNQTGPSDVVACTAGEPSTAGDKDELGR